MADKNLGNGRDKSVLNQESERETLVADLVITFTANPPTPASTQTVADGDIPTVAETGQFMANVEAKLNDIYTILKSQGLMKSS